MEASQRSPEHKIPGSLTWGSLWYFVNWYVNWLCYLPESTKGWYDSYIEGFVQDLLQSCAEPSICCTEQRQETVTHASTDKRSRDKWIMHTVLARLHLVAVSDTPFSPTSFKIISLLYIKFKIDNRTVCATLRKICICDRQTLHLLSICQMSGAWLASSGLCVACPGCVPYYIYIYICMSFRGGVGAGGCFQWRCFYSFVCWQHYWKTCLLMKTTQDKPEIPNTRRKFEWPWLDRLFHDRHDILLCYFTGAV